IDAQQRSRADIGFRRTLRADAVMQKHNLQALAPQAAQTGFDRRPDGARDIVEISKSQRDLRRDYGGGIQRFERFAQIDLGSAFPVLAGCIEVVDSFLERFGDNLDARLAIALNHEAGGWTAAKAYLGNEQI